ncbi:TetR/AcrR family transcriptional regulator [Devosia sp.]|uniref:TetR/AcrR family transcriptional regulator n=1 Tax=Devosia sp. TaxID=1871048 RepID=UPI002FC5B49A
MNPDRRRQILDAALACFLEKGYAATSVADIRTRSGASTGSIYHFFSGKGGLAEALLREAVSGWASLSAAALDPTATAEQALKASVRGLMLWAFEHPAQFRFMEEVRSFAPADPDFAAVRSLLDEGRALGAAQYARMTLDGAVRNLPFAIAHALMLGPAYAYLRLAHATPPDQATRVADLFAEAAWQAVRA